MDTLKRKHIQCYIVLQEHSENQVNNSNHHKWSNGVYYIFEPGASEKLKKCFHKAKYLWEKMTCVNFTQGQGDDGYGYLNVTDKYDYKSDIGRLGNEQIFSIGKKCDEEIGRAIRELGQVLGLYLTKDSHVAVMPEGMNKSALDELEGISQKGSDLSGKNHDYGSIIRSGSPAEKQNLADWNYRKTIGSHMISFMDLWLVNEYYGCHGTHALFRSLGAQTQASCASRNLRLGILIQAIFKTASFCVLIKSDLQWILHVHFDIGFKSTRLSFIPLPLSKTVFVAALLRNGGLNQCVWRHQKSEFEVSAKISPPYPKYPGQICNHKIEEMQLCQGRPSMSENIALPQNICKKEKKKVVCENGGFPHPRKCNERCICPIGYGGKRCKLRNQKCGGDFNATDQWQPLKISVRNEHELRRYHRCQYWIRSPNDTVIEIKIALIRNEFAQQGCPEAAVEIKTNDDHTLTGYRFPSKFAHQAAVPSCTVRCRLQILLTRRRENKAQVTFEFCSHRCIQQLLLLPVHGTVGVPLW
ncbi:hypothetical protein Y032_0038g3649 [Ancylostoma ceylanicum]|uniref:Peptidase M12A domain-containing protein n=1 Tax=Ancylostoma ceylanicum TaxID=53326 RepID=A0A016UIF3_9BILA|nr:hypothetical protein Y032_0038g3649 [Ancylostoma ceylanicum]